MFPRAYLGPAIASGTSELVAPSEIDSSLRPLVPLPRYPCASPCRPLLRGRCHQSVAQQANEQPTPPLQCQTWPWPWRPVEIFLGRNGKCHPREGSCWHWDDDRRIHTSATTGSLAPNSPCTWRQTETKRRTQRPSSSGSSRGCPVGCRAPRPAACAGDPCAAPSCTRRRCC